MSLTDLARSPHLARKGLLPDLVVEALEGGVDQFGRRMGTKQADRAVRAGIPPWHPRNDDDDDGGDDDADDGDGDDDGDDKDKKPAKKPAAKKPAARREDDDGDDDDDDADGDDAEKRALKRRLADSEKARKKLERDQAKAQRDKDEEEGEYKKLYEQEKARGDDLESKLKNGARDRTIVEQASKLKFHSPNSAIKLVRDDLPDDTVDEDGDVDETIIEKALKNLLKREPHHAAEPDDVQGDGAGKGDKTRRRSNGSGLDDDKIDPRARLRAGYARSGRR